MASGPGQISDDLVSRVQAYALKAAREGKQETSWTDPNEAYETALAGFVARLLDPQISAGFLDSFEKFARRAALLGALNSLSQLALKATLPGVPDFYQGTELWDLSLVDPDNRRPVDFSRRRELLKARESRLDRPRLRLAKRPDQVRANAQTAEAATRMAGPFPAQETTSRSKSPAHMAGHVIAFSREWKSRQAVVAVGRHFGPITNGGRDWPKAWDARLDLPTGNYDQVLSPLSDLCTGAVAASHLFASSSRQRPAASVILRTHHCPRTDARNFRQEQVR